MKKTLTVNLNGRVYTIDEDAYQLLDSYLSNLRIHFRKEEGGAEIINDFEARIEELFSEKIRSGYQIITIEHVEEVIARVGKLTDFASSDENEKQEKQTPFAETGKTKKKFFRNTDEKALGGVCSGIAAYFDWDTTIVRIVLILSLFVVFPFTFFAYIIAWIIVPAANTVEQKLQMKGQPITVENIGKTVAAQSEPTASKELNGFFGVIVTLVKVFFIGLGCLIALPLLFAFIVVIIVLFAVLFGVGGGLLGALPLFVMAEYPVLSIIMSIILLGIPVFALIYIFIAYIAKLKPLNQSVKRVLLITWILALIVLLISGFKFRKNVEIWNNKWAWPFVADFQEIRGNKIPTQKTIDFYEAVTTIETGNYLCANIQIVQTEDEMPSIEISGDENLVEQVRHDLNNGRLILSSYSRLRCDNNNLKIILRTSDLKSIQMNSVARVRIDRAFTGSELDVRIRGVGNFNADSLYVSSLNVRSEGVGSANIAGRSDKARLETAGVGKIDAMALLSDTVYARVDGVGSVNCNPVEYFEGRAHGVGSIIYKEEPKNKNISMSGVGKIRKR